jgi:hypothetical protein
VNFAHFKFRWLAVALLAASSANSATLYVAPNGKDEWTGRLPQPGADRRDGPLATLIGARNAVRALRAGGPLAEGVVVSVANGRYEITEPLVLTPQDSGTALSIISYEAAAGAKPIFSGGRAIRGWKPGKHGIWQTKVPEVAAGNWYFEQLFVNGRRAVRARTPNKFWFSMRDVREEPFQDASPRSKRARTKSARQIITLRAADSAAIGPLSPEDLRDANLVVYHKWDVTRRFIDAFDPAKRELTTSGEGMKPWNPWVKDTPFLVENFRGALDAPGEWFLSRDGTLYYKPLPREDMTRAEVIAPVAEKFIVMAGDPPAGRFVEHVRFKGLTFEHGQYLTPPGGFEPVQAAASLESAVLADGARHITIEACDIGHVGTYAIWFRRGCRDDRIEHCYMHDFGAGGVRIGETTIRPEGPERTGGITVDNNILRHGGCIFPCAVGVWVGQSGNNRVTHNEISDLFYTGISAGWTWGYGQSLSRQNTFAFNHVHHLGWGLLSDMGGIYTLGASEGTVVRNNVFHDIYSYSYGGWGLYTDEGSTGILFENNLVYDTKTGGFHQHYGKGNVLRNNIFAFSKTHQLEYTRAEPHLSFTFERNIVYWSGPTPLLQGAWDRGEFEAKNNWYWNAGGKVDFLGRSLAAWQAKGNEHGSRIIDPSFASPENRDFRLLPQSPATTGGFRPFDPSEAGVYGDPAWTAKAKEAAYPPLEIAPPPR